MLPNKPSQPGSESNKPSLYETQGDSMRSLVSTKVTTSQFGFGQRHLDLDHTSRVRRPKHARSTSSTSTSSSCHNPPPHPRHDCLAARVVISIRNHLGQSPTPLMLTSGSPTSNSHMRVGSVSNRGSSNSDGVRHRQIRRAPVSRLGPTSTTRTHTQIRRAKYSEHLLRLDQHVQRSVCLVIAGRKLTGKVSPRCYGQRNICDP